LFINGCSQQQSAQASLSNNPLIEAAPKRTFVLTDIDDRNTTLSLKQDRLQLSRVVQPYVLLHFFSTHVDLSRGMLPYLSALQREHRHLFVLGVVVPESIDTPSLRQYMRQTKTTFFVSRSPDNLALGNAIASMLKLAPNYSLPLTVLYHRGHYVAHYEGVTPIEMIRSDLNKSVADSGEKLRTNTKEK